MIIHTCRQVPYLPTLGNRKGIKKGMLLSIMRQMEWPNIGRMCGCNIEFIVTRNEIKILKKAKKRLAASRPPRNSNNSIFIISQAASSL